MYIYIIYIYIYKYHQVIKKIKGLACEGYQNLSKAEKEKKWQYGCERCKSLSEDKKNKLLIIEKNIIKWEKTVYYNLKKLS